MIRLNVNTFLGADGREAVDQTSRNVELAAEHEEVVCYCMYGKKRHLFIGFMVLLAICVIGSGFCVLMAWFFGNELYVGGIVGGCCSIVVIVFYVFMNRVNRPEVRVVTHYEPSDASPDERRPLLNT